MGTRVMGSTTLSTTTSSEPLFGHKLTASQNYEERMLVCHFQSHKLSLRLHTFWTLAWGRKSVTRGRDHHCVICQRQMWNTCYRISSAMILVLCNTLCKIQNTSLKYVLQVLQNLWYVSHNTKYKSHNSRYTISCTPWKLSFSEWDLSCHRHQEIIWSNNWSTNLNIPA